MYLENVLHRTRRMKVIAEEILTLRLFSASPRNYSPELRSLILEYGELIKMMNFIFDNNPIEIEKNYDRIFKEFKELNNLLKQLLR